MSAEVAAVPTPSPPWQSAEAAISSNAVVPLKVHNRILAEGPLPPISRVRYVPVGQNDVENSGINGSSALERMGSDVQVNGRSASAANGTTTRDGQEDVRKSVNESRNSASGKANERKAGAGEDNRSEKSKKSTQDFKSRNRGANGVAPKDIKREKNSTKDSTSTHTPVAASASKKSKTSAGGDSRKADSNGRKRPAPSDSESSDSFSSGDESSSLKPSKSSGKTKAGDCKTSGKPLNGTEKHKPPKVDASRHSSDAPTSSKRAKLDGPPESSKLRRVESHSSLKSLRDHVTSPHPYLGSTSNGVKSKRTSEEQLSTGTAQLRDFDTVSLDSAQSAPFRNKDHDSGKKRDVTGAPLKGKKDYRYMAEKAMKPCVDISRVIAETQEIYEIFGAPARQRVDGEKLKFETVMLEYPGTDAVESYPLAYPRKSSESHPVSDLLTTATLIVKHCVPSAQQSLFGDANSGMLRALTRAVNRADVPALHTAVEDFNTKMKELKGDGVFDESEFLGPPAPYVLAVHIQEQAYARTIAPHSELLNKYRGFSNQVYGEVKNNLVQEFVRNSELKPNHVFLDMGSGIGNVVLQVAATVLCESWGVELMEYPARFAAKQKREFLSRMRYYAKPCGRISLRWGDMCEDKVIHDVLKRADVVYVNNFAFSPELNQQILDKFLDLRDGTRIISLRAFTSQDRKITLRNANSVESILKVKEYFFGEEMVSWTNEGGRYYIQTVDRSALRKFQESMMR